MNSEFKTLYTLAERKRKHANITQHNRERIGIIVDIHSKNKIHLHKFLVPREMTFGALHRCILSSHSHEADVSYYLFVAQHAIVPSFETVESAHKQYSDTDGFLYVQMREESTFG